MAHLIVLTCLACLTQVSSDGLMDAAQFARVLGGLHSPIRDFEMICEGEFRLVKDDPDRAEKAKTREIFLQSNYAFRSDGRAILDEYEKLITDNSMMSRRTFCLVGNELETRILAGGLKPNPASIMKGGGNSDSVDQRNGSAGRFNFVLFWNRHLAKYPDLPGYVCHGWEKIDGHDCLKITIDGEPAAPGLIKLVFWIDMNRGGHVLKQEYYHDGVLWFRKHQIELGQFKLPDGSPIWFPVRGVFDTHTYYKGPSVTPVFHEVESVVQGTLVFNQGLPDSRFSLDWNGRVTSSDGYEAMQRSFSGLPPKTTQAPLRRDPAGVEAYQKEKLAEVEKKADKIDASPSAQRGGHETTMVQVALGGVGLLALLFAYKMRSGLR